LISSIASTVTGDTNVRRCENILYAGPKSARNLFTHLKPDSARLASLQLKSRFQIMMYKATVSQDLKLKKDDK